MKTNKRLNQEQKSILDEAFRLALNKAEVDYERGITQGYYDRGEYRQAIRTIISTYLTVLETVGMCDERHIYHPEAAEIIENFDEKHK